MAYFVYVLCSRRAVLYVGMTNDLARRVQEHKERAVPGFTSRYGVDRLVYCEVCRDVRDAIQREKQIKNWSRKKKIALIEAANPRWEELAPA